jgi:hypothetical protein
VRRASERLVGPLVGAACAAALALATEGRALAQYCPSYTASSAYNDHDCAIEAAEGADPDTSEWNAIFDLVSQGPEGWGDAGPSAPDIGAGCGKPEPLTLGAPRFPCELLKAIAQQESGWTQFCVPTTPADQVGGASRTIISFDCGYGVGQVTSGMHVGESPNFDRERVASDPTYNLATGTRILAGKWNATECVGDNQPELVEHWYAAAWAYNGLAYVNNPNNPNYDPNRGVWVPTVGGGAPYQEKVFGRMEFPYGDLWAPIEPAYPNPGDIGGGSAPPELPDPSCASPTDCQGTRPLHVSTCLAEPPVGGSGGGGGEGAAGGASPEGGGGAGGEGGAGPGGAAPGGVGQGAGSNLVGVRDEARAARGSCACELDAQASGGRARELGGLAALPLAALSWFVRSRRRSRCRTRSTTPS